MIRLMLEQAGHEVSTASDGQKGVYLLEDDMVDLVVTDILMPAKDGLEAIREIHSRYPQVKILAISGGSHRFEELDFLGAAERFGAARTLAKPFSRAQLLDAVEQLLAPNP